MTNIVKNTGKKIESYRNKLKNYKLRIISVDSKIDEATDIFTRMNTGGKPLSAFDIMVAKTHDEKHEFNLEEKYQKLMTELSDVGYDEIPPMVILRVFAAILKQDCREKEILKISKEELIHKWNDGCESIKEAITFFRNHNNMGIPVSKLLPYYDLLVPYSYYFYKKKEDPVGEESKKLVDMFWRISLGFRYSQSSVAKMNEDIQKVDSIMANKEIELDWRVFIEPNEIEEHGEFKTSSSYIKSLLSIMASNNPQNFHNESKVNVENSYLKRSDSKNYHHFFPKDYLKKNKPDVGKKKSNNILNITLISERLNKNIKNKAPSVYIDELKRNNANIEDTMRSHFINDLNKCGVFDDDYDKFLKERAKILSKKAKSLLLNYSLRDEQGKKTNDEDEDTDDE